MTFDQRPPAPTLRRRLALATKGARLALANGVAKMLGLKLQAYEPQRAPVDLTPKPAKVPPPAAPKPAPAPTAAEPAPAPVGAPSVPAPAAAPAPARPTRPDRFAPDPAFAIHIDECTVCGDPLAELVKDDYCPNCNSPARTRALPPLLDLAVGPAVAAAEIFDLPMLGFAMTGVEKQLTAQVFPVQKSVSLFGNYGGDH